MSRISLSSVPPTPASSTVIRSSIFPGGESNTSRCGAVATGAAESGRSPPRVVGRRGRRRGCQRRVRRAAAEDEITGGRRGKQRHATGLWSRRAPVTCGSGSQMSVTRVLPFSPRSVPIHVRTYLPACTEVAIDASAVCTGLATSGVGFADLFDIGGGQRPESLARADVHVTTLHPHA